MERTAHDIIKTVMVTEKSNDLKEEMKQYFFKVASDANKIEIKQAIEKLFEVKVKSVNTLNYQGKLKRAGRSRKAGRRASWKKAVVTLSEGEIEVI